MATYPDLKQAKEAVGAFARCILEIDLKDLHGMRPQDTFFTPNLTLHLCKGEPFLRNDTGVPFRFYEALVKDFGTLTEECWPGSGLGVISDMQIVLHNTKLMAQLDNPDYNFGTSGGLLSPAPRGDEVKLSEVFQFYNWAGADVRLGILFLSTGYPEQSSGNNHLLDYWFRGNIEDIDFGDGTDITLDITQSRLLEETELPARLMSDSMEPELRTLRMPIAYGDYSGPTENIPFNDETNGVNAFRAQACRLVRAPMVPGIPWTRPEDDDKHWHLIWADQAGRNPGYEDNAKLGPFGYFSTRDQVFVEKGGVLILIDKDGGGSPPDDGEVSWETTGTVDTELALRVGKYLAGEAHIDCVDLVEEAVSGDLINPGNLFDFDPYTTADLKLDNAGRWCLLKPRDVSGLGLLRPEDDCIVAYIVVALSRPINFDTRIRFGLGTYIEGLFLQWVGVDTLVDAHGLRSEPRLGHLDASGSPPKIDAGFYEQGIYDGTKNLLWSGTYNIIKDGYGATPLVGMQWKYPRHGIFTGQNQASFIDEEQNDVDGTMGDVVVKIEVERAGGFGARLKIIQAGIIAKVRVQLGKQQQPVIESTPPPRVLK